MVRPKAYVAWSSGKDAAYAMMEVVRLGSVHIVGLLTTVTETFDRVAMHGVREDILDRQADALGLPLLKVPIPYPCPNDIYEERMAAACAELKARNVEHVVFGDIFLTDVRAYRERQMARAGLTGLFPLWGRPTADLARDMIACGIEANLVCIDPNRLAKRFAGRRFDTELLNDLPPAVDACGENGEFHTLITAGPLFAHPVQVQRGQTIERDGFVFTDFHLD